MSRRIISIIRVAVSRNPWTRSMASSSIHVTVNPSPAAPKSVLGYKDFRIPRVRLDAFLMLERMISRDQVGSMSSNLGACNAVSKSCG
jgi:hypothetical protein